jgi:hypothetical protein
MILLWLLPTAVATALAMGLAGWIGRRRPDRERTAADQERFAAAIQRPLPTARPRPGVVARGRERSTGVAVRRTGEPVEVTPVEAAPAAAVEAEPQPAPAVVHEPDTRRSA